MFKPSDLFDLSQTAHAGLFDGCEYAWDALKEAPRTTLIPKSEPPQWPDHGGLSDQSRKLLAAELLKRLNGYKRPGVFIGDQVLIGEGTMIEDGAMIKGPAIIGRNCEIRHNAYIREHVLIGDECVVGNACEFKHSLLFNHSVVPHFSYVGDSILGCKAHLGAGVKDFQREIDAGQRDGVA